ncbi:MAG: hypothetical protein HYV09_09210 [Deltaproteobacteria bacterium]|nr:hypothetical protein [Deltaproteobacteria bacterium]
MRAPLLASLILAAAAVACSGAPARPAAATAATSQAGGAPVGMRPAGTPETAKAQIVPTDDDAGGTAAEVFERARLELTAGKYAHARVLFDRVVTAEAAEHPGAPGPLGRAAAYNAALCSENLGDARDARDRFRALSKAAPGTSDAVDANLRRGRLDVEIEDWNDVGESAAVLLSSPDLSRWDRAEALALQALGMIHGAKDLSSAKKTVVQAEKLLEKKDKPDEVPPPHNAAAVHFARGDLLRAEGDAMAFLDDKDPSAPIVAADFPVKMEARCQKILDAQDAYIDAINTRELAWAVRAGLRVATMYIELHRDVLAIPPPKSATTDEKKQLFKGAMRLRYRILLEKGLGTLDRTLNLETAVGAKTAWLEHARKAKATVEKQLADEKAELAKLPYSEEELKKALDNLSKKSAKA